MKYGVEVEVVQKRIVHTFVDARSPEEAEKLAKQRVFEQEQRTTGGEVTGIQRVLPMEWLT